MDSVIVNRKLSSLNYGAAELKDYSKTAALKGFSISSLLFVSIFIALGLLIQDIAIEEEKIIQVPTTITTVNVKVKLPDIVQKTNSSVFGVENPQIGTKKIAGNFIPINDNSSTVNISDIAVFDNVGISSSTLGESDNINETIKFDRDINKNNDVIEKQTTPISDEIFEFAEVEPIVDLAKLHSSIIYPELARKANVEGSVLVNVLISSKGEVIDSKIIESDNLLLNNAALDAIRKPGIFKPAYQNNSPVNCWLTIPIKFRIK